MSGIRVSPSQKAALGACGLFCTCQRDFYPFSVCLGVFKGGSAQELRHSKPSNKWAGGGVAVPIQRRTQQSQAEAETRSLCAPGSAVTSFSSPLACETVSGFNKLMGFMCKVLFDNCVGYKRKTAPYAASIKPGFRRCLPTRLITIPICIPERLYTNHKSESLINNSPFSNTV